MTARDVVEHAVRLFLERRPDRLESRAMMRSRGSSRRVLRELFVIVWMASKPSNSG